MNQLNQMNQTNELNFDEWFQICLYLSAKNLFNLAQTCHFCYQVVKTIHQKQLGCGKINQWHYYDLFLSQQISNDDSNYNDWLKSGTSRRCFPEFGIRSFITLPPFNQDVFAKIQFISYFGTKKTFKFDLSEIKDKIYTSEEDLINFPILEHMMENYSIIHSGRVTFLIDFKAKDLSQCLRTFLHHKILFSDIDFNEIGTKTCKVCKSLGTNFFDIDIVDENEPISVSYPKFSKLPDGDEILMEYNYTKFYPDYSFSLKSGGSPFFCLSTGDQVHTFGDRYLLMISNHEKYNHFRFDVLDILTEKKQPLIDCNQLELFVYWNCVYSIDFIKASNKGDEFIMSIETYDGIFWRRIKKGLNKESEIWTIDPTPFDCETHTPFHCEIDDKIYVI